MRHFVNDHGTRASRAGVWLCLVGMVCVTVFVMGGCEEEAVREYRVPKSASHVSAMAEARARQVPGVAAGGGQDGGPTSGSGAGQMTGGGGTAGGGELSYEVPDGWQRAQGGSGMRVASFAVGPEGSRAEVTIVPLSGGAGSLTRNVNRWRGQIGLGPATQQQIEQSVAPIEVAGQQGQYVELGPPGQGQQGGERILAVVLQQGGRSWFFKMRGPSQTVQGHREEFRAFVQSVRFGQPADESSDATNTNEVSG